MEPYRSYFPNASLLLPVTERLSESVMVLPTGTAVGMADIARVCGLIELAHQEAPRVRTALATRQS